ncbi:MAG: hypothetical protein AMXMBFR45_15550 [Gammaproteobacteria bacterium]|nr:MAG: DUF1249 domain-containing protein [Pseudomonadota bacterium]MBC6945289.1 DUF1249 domain-containing protein [Gammaproteobacteria bacterium]MCE7901066.1 DUF1249 domain-containing protein [Gammaproteobacteria bacterium PRO9]MCQ3933380.1 DUF1249 domain-containing protein [Gammaproteobacteria bacterium]MDL1880148.1 DUF1249 domain-containing protein [Gammaproteobacteria bacterium PRO2]
MIADSYIVPECLVRPGSLGSLISLYEGNYLKLSALLGDPARPIGPAVSRVPRDGDLHLLVEEGSRYTRLLRLSYLFDEPAGPVAEPDVAVRLYLDARVAAVTAWAGFQRHPRLAGLATEYAGEIDRRWACNMAFGKWLDFLLENGHSYGLKP